MLCNCDACFKNHGNIRSMHTVQKKRILTWGSSYSKTRCASPRIRNKHRHLQQSTPTRPNPLSIWETKTCTVKPNQKNVRCWHYEEFIQANRLDSRRNIQSNWKLSNECTVLRPNHHFYCPILNESYEVAFLSFVARLLHVTTPFRVCKPMV